jgi:murein L,D-transpeptidase YafK
MKRLKYLLIFIVFSIITLSIYQLWPEPMLAEDAIIDKIIVVKSARKMTVYSEGNELKSYRISLGKEPTGKKEYEGDNKTPEGIYTINDKNPNSGYHLNLGISYPDSKDIEHANYLGKPPGGAIKIHGLRNEIGVIGKSHRLQDWTAGCIAVTNEEVEELYRCVPIGTEIEIRP